MEEPQEGEVCPPLGDRGLNSTLLLWHEFPPEINRLPEKSRRIIKNALARLEKDPFPGKEGDKEEIMVREGRTVYRLHISRRYTVFYEIDTEENLVIVQEILSIEQAHKKYGHL
jgi:mRNA interferase RelE/StbE